MTADTVSTPDQVTSAPSDLRRLFGSHLIVVGFFTPDYAEAASAFSKNLIEHSVSHHLYARAKVDGGWRAQIFQKPATLAVARRDYPDAVLVFMDVDCSIRGDISGIVETRGDPMHDPQRPGWAARKGAEKFFRTGRNAAYRLATGKSYDERRKR